MGTEDRILLLDILAVLKTYSDIDHGLTQREIIELLEKEYGYQDLYTKRKTIKNNIDKLLSYSEVNKSGINELIYEESIREENTKDDQVKKAKVLSDFRYIHEFTQGELRLIIDSILFSKQISKHQREELIKKLEDLASKNFNSKVGHIEAMPKEEPINQELFMNIEEIDRAIENSVKISFYYNNYSLDENQNLVLEKRKRGDGSARKYLINPYQMVATNGRYYLICNNDAFDNLSHYRLDRMTNIQVLNARRRPLKELQRSRIDIANYMNEHIYMFRGESVRVKLKFKKYVLNEFIDWFGTNNLSFSKEDDDELTVRVKVNREAMRKWALQYGLHVTVLSPSDLVDDIKSDIKKALARYESL